MRHFLSIPLVFFTIFALLAAAFVIEHCRHLARDGRRGDGPPAPRSGQ